MVNQRLLFKFGLKKEVLEVMNIDVMILESDHCREQTMGVIKNFVFVSNGLDCVFSELIFMFQGKAFLFGNMACFLQIFSAFSLLT